MNSKHSGSDSKMWRSYSSAMLLLANWVKWDITLLTCGRIWYRFECVMWAVASAYLFQDLLCLCLKCYGPNVVLLHSGIPVRYHYLPMWDFSKSFRNVSHWITYHLQLSGTYKQPSVPSAELQESTHCKHNPRHEWVTKSMDVATAGDHWSRCRHHLWLQLPLPLSVILFSSSHSQWIWNDGVGFWIWHRGRQDSKTAGRGGTDNNAGCGAGYNATCWDSSRCWCVTPAGTPVEVGVFIVCRYAVDRVEVTCWVITATPELSGKMSQCRSDVGLQWLQDSLLDWNLSCQPVRKHVSFQAEVENSLSAHTFVDSDD